jgi:hypothetical protein
VEAKDNSWVSAEEESTYNVGLRLAMVTGSEATLTALGGGRLQVRRKSATGHCVCGLRVKGKDTL